MAAEAGSAHGAYRVLRPLSCPGIGSRRGGCTRPPRQQTTAYRGVDRAERPWGTRAVRPPGCGATLARLPAARLAGPAVAEFRWRWERAPARTLPPAGRGPCSRGASPAGICRSGGSRTTLPICRTVPVTTPWLTPTPRSAVCISPVSGWRAGTPAALGHVVGSRAWSRHSAVGSGPSPAVAGPGPREGLPSRRSLRNRPRTPAERQVQPRSASRRGGAPAVSRPPSSARPPSAHSWT